MFFITGTDTNIGKTIVSSWLCAHSGYGYFKPIQTGSIEGSDSRTVEQLTGVKIYKESYVFKQPLSPHLAARLENATIDMARIVLPANDKLIIEGAGGLLVPINDKFYMIDLIKQLNIPAILVTRTTLGTINHTLLSIQALRQRSIPVAGIIMSGEANIENRRDITRYSGIEVLAELPVLSELTGKSLLDVPLSAGLKKLFGRLKHEPG